MNKFWIMIMMLFSVNMMASNNVKADEALVAAEIYKKISSKRTFRIPGAIDKGWGWGFENSRYDFVVAVDEQWYNRVRYQKEKRSWKTGDYLPRDATDYLPTMVYEGTQALQKLVREFERVTRNWKPERKVNFVLAFVQSIPWTDDSETGYDEFYKYPGETIVECEGDCEDTSMLLASILSGLGFEVVLINLPGHIAVGVEGNFRGYYYLYKNDKYFYCETTSRRYKLGMIRKDYENETAQIIRITTNPVQPQRVRPRTVPPGPEPQPPPSPQRAFENGKKLYYDARYNEAIKSLQFALSGLKNSEQRAEVYIYLGFAEYAFEEGRISVAEARAKDRFQAALRQNPNQKLDNPKFKPWFEEVRRESIGELTISTSPRQTEIWISGNGIDRKYLGTGTRPINMRLFKGSYTVEGVYAGRSKKQIIEIKPRSERKLTIEISVDTQPPTIVFLSSPKIAEVNQRILVKAQVTDEIAIKQVYLFYAFSRSGTSKPLEYDRVALTKNTLGIYEKYIRSEKVGYIWYYLTATDGEGNRRESEKKVVEIKPNRSQPPPDNKSPTIELLSPPEVASINQRVLVEAQVTDDTAVKSVYLFYGLSHSYFSEPSEYERIVLMKTTSNIYTGYIPYQSETGYIWYYLAATDIGGARSKSAKKLLKIKSDRPDLPKSFELKYPNRQGIWVNYAWSNNVFQNHASVFDLDRGDSISLTYLSEGRSYQTFGAQLDFSNQNPANVNATFQWAPALEESPITVTLLGGVAEYSSRQYSNEPYTTPILGAGLKFYPLDRVSVDAICSFKQPSNFDTTYLYHYEIGTRIYINDLFNLKLGYSQFHLGGENHKRMQIGLGFTF